jgi:hypothetical protein
MHTTNAAPPFPLPVLFDDVEDAILAQEDITVRTSRTLLSGGAWHMYLRKVLPPLAQPDEIPAD